MTRSLVLDMQKNFADGKGLVFNEGEFVEGYTNFFWTILLIPFHLSNQIDPVEACYFFGILSFLELVFT